MGSIQIPNLIEVQMKSYQRLPADGPYCRVSAMTAGFSPCSRPCFRSGIFREMSQLSSWTIRSATGNASVATSRPTPPARHLPELRRIGVTNPYQTGDVICHKCGTFNKNTADVLQQMRRSRRHAAQVRRERVPGARHDVFRAGSITTLDNTIAHFLPCAANKRTLSCRC